MRARARRSARLRYHTWARASAPASCAPGCCPARPLTSACRACRALASRSARLRGSGSDPAAYEMLQKIQLLQKRLIGKASESVSKSSELAAKDRLYAELKAILARQPGPEIAEQLAAYRNSLKEKDQQSEQMASELAM